MKTVGSVLWLAVLVAACSSDAVDVVQDVAEVVDSGLAEVVEVVIQPEDVKVDSGPDLPFVHDQTADFPVLECDPGEGCFGDGCGDNEDCDSGWCVQHMGESVCSKHCEAECPAGWTCKQVSATGPDVVYICVSDHANLCRPCADADDCESAGGAEDACVSYGEGGNFCGGSCNVGLGGGEECPWGFSCQDSVTVEGVQVLQCVNDAGVCPCTQASVARGLSTPCKVENDFGVCEGKRVCTEEGLGECDAPAPGPEVCNGTLFCDTLQFPHQCAVAPGTVVECPGPEGVGAFCLQPFCEPSTGVCSLTPDHEGLVCANGDACTFGDKCVEGVCAAGAPVNCKDGNVCTDDSCDPAVGCLHDDNAAACDDGNVCTSGDTCSGGGLRRWRGAGLRRRGCVQRKGRLRPGGRLSSRRAAGVQRRQCVQRCREL